MKDDLRIHQVKNGKRSGFDEKELARIRQNFGINAFFESPEAFRNKIKIGKLKIYKYPFRNKEKQPIGIPQGLPISALLANLYLLEFDRNIIKILVKGLGCYYRRYSDDIVVICNPNQKQDIEKFVMEAIQECKIEISKDKTEVFHYKWDKLGNKDNQLVSYKLGVNESKKIYSFKYLGFEFNGRNTLIKSANLARFYRRMIYFIKKKAQRAIKDSEQNNTPLVIYKRQLYKQYMNVNLNKTCVKRRYKILTKTYFGYKWESKEKDKKKCKVVTFHM